MSVTIAVYVTKQLNINLKINILNHSLTKNKKSLFKFITSLKILNSLM